MNQPESIVHITHRTEFRIRVALRLYISQMRKQRRKTQEVLGLKAANSFWNNDIREAIQTYRDFVAGIQ